MISVNQAGQLIKKTTNRVQKRIPNADIPDIIKLILHGDCESAYFTADLAPQMVGSTDMETLKNIFNLVLQKIKYKRDKNREVIKSPGKLWADGLGDCKSYSVFIGSLLKNLGYKYKYRVTFYDPEHPDKGHIYPIVLLNGKEIVMDAVPLPWMRGARKFNDEQPYWKKYDYYPTCGNNSISGIGAPNNQLGWAIAATIGFIMFANMWK